MRYHIDKPDETIRNIVNTTFPSYKGRTYTLSTNVPSQLNSYWDGGSKDSYIFYELSTGKTFHVATNHPFFERENPRDLKALPPGVILVCHSIFCGKDMGITIYADEMSLAPLLPPKTDVTDDERIVLTYTARLKNTYGGETNIRYRNAKRDTGISPERWNAAKSQLIGKGLLRKNGAITPQGRNAIEH